MKSPITNKEMVLKKEPRRLKFRGEEFEYLYHFWFDEGTEDSFTDTELDEINLRQVYNQYLEKYKLPFPEQIITLRKKYNLSARKMSQVLGFGINTYGNYEKGEVPSLANAKLIELAEDPQKFKTLTEESIEVFNEKEKSELLKIADRLTSEGKTEEIINYFIYKPKEKPDIYTGYRVPSINRLGEMIIFFIQQIPDVAKTQINKLLFYADFLNFKRTCQSISGMEYVAIDFGTVPQNFQMLFEHLQPIKNFEIERQILSEDTFKDTFKLLPNTVFNKNIFTDEEIRVLEKVANKFKNNTRKEIVEMNHEEIGWKENINRKGFIKYTYAFDLINI
jgi:transcriptional regulator with XRE-family HTH domain